ncbi:MAG: (2Fe-2S)-binding protein [Alphaproteobacteria bacterium]|nr:(2Fe-2S)-binding protein [Alphaproteobacteria bacterium]
MPPSQFTRLAERERRRLTLTIDGAAVTALEGDTLLTAILTNARRVRANEFDRKPRAGFCLMGACQDCWVELGNGDRARACTTFVAEGMDVRTGGGS